MSHELKKAYPHELKKNSFRHELKKESLWHDMREGRGERGVG